MNTSEKRGVGGGGTDFSLFALPIYPELRKQLRPLPRRGSRLAPPALSVHYIIAPLRRYLAASEQRRALTHNSLFPTRCPPFTSR